MEETFIRFKLKILDTLAEYPQLRPGQAAYTALAGVRPDLADRVIGTALDPFYIDNRLGAFLDFVEENWTK